MSCVYYVSYLLLYCLKHQLLSSTTHLWVLHLCYLQIICRPVVTCRFVHLYCYIRIDLYPLTVQYNAMQCNAMQCNAMQCNAMQCNAMQCNAMQCNAMQCNAMQCNAMQCNAMQCNAIQYNTIQYNLTQSNTIEYKN